ncbi:ankyrin repeat and KH domain-containing protein 1 isoform X2 [Nematostella vectensis]|uniref:ankyrin repeat and KH domain-containing protein 1 isoform X2 n=1 Tax=Nematostella vectensis TaxID=45351 RepID=UPI0020775039|nr:ankyrin repeat and KH domain-containing protein 1 isoform X2 [Nematostella vectensis]
MSNQQSAKTSLKSSGLFDNDRSPSISESDSEEEEDDDLDNASLESAAAMEYILNTKRSELTSKLMLPGSDGLSKYDLHKMDPETQARLGALFEAAGMGKLADGKVFADPEVLRRLTSSVSSALDEAAAALTRMRAQNSTLPSSPNHTGETGARSLADACLEGDVGAVRQLLEEGWSVHEPTDEGESLLSLACSAGYYELVQVLLAMEASVDDRGSKGDCTPLMEAASGGYVEIVKLLLDNIADVNAQSQAGNTALIYACCGGYEDVVKLLLEHGADIEVHNENGHTPLMEAASGGHVGVAKLLLENGACINSHSNEFKESALTLACYKGHLDMVKFLLDAGADQEHKTDEMHTALMEASMDGHVEVARLLLDHGAQVNMPADSFESPLTLAACGGHVELATLLIERGAYLEEVNDEGYTPLMEAAREGHLEMVSLLLDHGADIHVQTEETQETALSLACCGGFQDVAAYLLQAGADIEQGSSTPLMEAAQEGHVDLVKFLLEQGADVNATTATGDTALSFACENGHTDVADVLLQSGADLEHESEGGRTPLMKAARAGHLCTVQFLISRGADVDRQTSNNDHSVLSLACAGGHLAVVELLLAHGANPYHKLKDGSNMVIEAAKGGHAAVICYLLENPIPGTPPDLQLSMHTSMAIPSVPPPRVPPTHASQPPVLEHQDLLPDLSAFGPEGLALGQLPLAPPTSPLCELQESLLLPDMPITSSAMAPTFPLLSQSIPSMSTTNNAHVTSIAVQTDNKVITEKLQLIQGKLAKALKNANIPLDSNVIPKELLTTDLSHFDLDGDDVPAPPAPFLVPNMCGELTPEEHAQLEGLMVAEPAQTLHDTIGDMLSNSSSNDSSPPTPPELSTSSLPLTPSPSPVSPPFTAAFDVDQQTDSNHDTALTLAAAGGHDELVQLLLAKGSDIEHRDKKGCTPLILSATAGHNSTVEILMEHGADIEAQSDRTKDTALSLACSGGRQEVVELLIAKGANFEHRNVSDYTPLSLAASGGYVGIIKLLLSHGAEINSRTGSKLGISPLMLAAMNGHTSAVKLLLDMGSDINAQIETNRNTALTLACFQGRHEVVSLLVDRKANIEHRAKTGLTPLMEAASGGYVEVGRILLDRGADVNAPPVPSSRDTALTIAADKGHYKFCELLLYRGAMVDVKNKKGNSPLWLAANGGHLEVCQLLFSYGADFDSQDNRKVTVLMAAFRKGHIKVVKWLVKHVHQFPSDSDCTRFISTISDKDLLKRCHQCMEIIVTAKDRQAAEANKNASILLEEIDLEKEREELKKAAAARRRDKKKQKKKKKLTQDKDVETENKNNEEKEKLEDDADQDHQSNDSEGEGSNERTKSPISSIIDNTNSQKSDTDRKLSSDTLGTLTTMAISAAISSSSATKPLDVSSVITSEFTKAVASTIMTITQATPHSALSPITVATAAAQCLAVTLTTSHPITKMSVMPSPKKGKRHEEGWKEVVRRSKKMSVSSSVVSRIIGRAGCNVNAIRETTGAHIDIDTSRQKSTGSCIITIKGPADATRQAHHLISALIKDPECDINDVLPRRKTPLSPRTLSSFPIATSMTTVTTVTSSAKPLIRETCAATLPSPALKLSGKTKPTPAIPSSGSTAITAKTTTSGSNHEKVNAASHIPSSAKWGLTAHGGGKKKSPGKSEHILGNGVPTSSSKRYISGKLVTTTTVTTMVISTPRISPAKRQLFPDKTVVVTTQSTTSKTKRVPSSSLSYSSVAMGAQGGPDPSQPTALAKPVVNGPVISKPSAMVTCTVAPNVAMPASTVVNTSSLPTAFSNLLSHVSQTLSPSIWNNISHPSSFNPDMPKPSTNNDPVSQPLFITTPGALFTPLPHETSATSPPYTSASPVPTTTPSASSSPTISPIGSSLAQCSTVDSMDKPSLRPIGTERACRRATASPLPSMPGISPLIGGDGAPPPGVWSYSYAPERAVSGGWSTAPGHQAPSSQLVGNGDSVPVPESEQFGVNPGDTLQSFLERLSLGSHLSLFQKNEIDLDALMLMSEKDYADIGLPKGPRVKLLNSTRRLYPEVNEFSSATTPTSPPPPNPRPVGRAARWSHQPPEPPTTLTTTGIPYGNKRIPGRDADPNKQQPWKAWSRTSV